MTDAEIVAWLRSRLANDRALSRTSRDAFARAADAIEENARLRALLADAREMIVILGSHTDEVQQAVIEAIDAALRKPDAAE